VAEDRQSIVQVARSYSVGETKIGNWLRKHWTEHAEDEPLLRELSVRVRLYELQSRNPALELENALRKRRRCSARGSRGREKQVYAFIAAKYVTHDIAAGWPRPGRIWLGHLLDGIHTNRN
jgi:transposase-like protein